MDNVTSLPSAEALLQALPFAAYTVDASGRLTAHNQAAVSFWGAEPAPDARWSGCQNIYHVDGRAMTLEECPLAQTLRTGESVAGVEMIIERPDGSRLPFRAFPRALKDEQGRIVGGIDVLMDMTDQHRMVADSARMAAIVSNSDDAIISKTLDGVITSWNAGAQRIFGYTPEEVIGQPITKIIPFDLHSEEKQIIARLARGERIEHYETVRLAKDGRLVDISLTVSPLRDASGKVVGASKVARDVSERKRSEETQRLLLNELNHRIKNTLATVQAIASQTLRRSPSPSEFVTSFSGRIQALSRAHMLLTGSTFQNAEAPQLVREQLLLGGQEDSRITYTGPSLTLEADAALHLALVLHELGTNARKHGALSTPNGSVSIRWEMQTGEGRTFNLDWVERGGPPVRAPSTRGFGTVLIERSLQAHGGSAITHYAEEGVSCVITLPMTEQTQDAPREPFARRASSLADVAPGTAPLSGRRVLIVEDEPLIALDLSDHLADAGAEVVGLALSFEDAQAFIDKGDFDTAVLDGNLAGRSADALALALTRKGKPFIFVTGYGREALPAGFREGVVIEKPFTREQLVAALAPLGQATSGVTPLKRPEAIRRRH